VDVVYTYKIGKENYIDYQLTHSFHNIHPVYLIDILLIISIQTIINALHNGLNGNK
jgi:hypothetical protein